MLTLLFLILLLVLMNLTAQPAFSCFRHFALRQASLTKDHHSLRIMVGVW